METEVLFTRKENTLTITLNKNAEYKEIKQKLVEILSASDDIFEGLEEAVIVEGRRLLDEEEKEVEELLKEKTDLEIRIERPKQMGLSSIDNIFNKDTTITNTKVYTGTIRSGQRIEFEGSVVILGDVILHGLSFSAVQVLLILVAWPSILSAVPLLNVTL